MVWPAAHVGGVGQRGREKKGRRAPGKVAPCHCVDSQCWLSFAPSSIDPKWRRSKNALAIRVWLTVSIVEMTAALKQIMAMTLIFGGGLMMRSRLLGDEVLGMMSPSESWVDADFPTLFSEQDRVYDQAASECDAIRGHLAGSPSKVEPWDWRLLPDGLLWRSYLASPHEPRISMIIFNDTNEGIFWDVSLGGRVGLLRYGTTGANRPRGWQWDLEGAVITRLDLLNSEDVESMDYRFGSVITAAEGPWAMKVGYFHVSSHVGDEYLQRNPTFLRVNYVTESWIVGVSYSAADTFRVYSELAYAFGVSGGAKRYQIQSGMEYTPVAPIPHWGAPFAAVNFNFRETVDYDVSTTIQIGWSFQGPESGRRLRYGLQYGDGPTSQYEFFNRREEYLGLGVWFDY